MTTTQLETTKQQKIKELEKKKEEQDEFEKTHSIENNFKILNDVVIGKQNKQNKQSYAKQFVCCNFQDKEILPALKSIYNLLQIMNNRIDK